MVICDQNVHQHGRQEGAIHCWAVCVWGVGGGRGGGGVVVVVESLRGLKRAQRVRMFTPACGDVGVV